MPSNPFIDVSAECRQCGRPIFNLVNNLCFECQEERYQGLGDGPVATQMKVDIKKLRALLDEEIAKSNAEYNDWPLGQP
tara:strand:+ start:640 stop:876 length:237 start_codon:yes stop_codon:yes gene_type:complete